ncbi:MAG: hypothetical protein JSS34_02620 [Proteobacteria bacterium]|nr:hypothetical protein [Pseudomonadota bacterium]
MRKKLKISFMVCCFFVFSIFIFISSPYAMLQEHSDISETRHPRPLKILPYIQEAIISFEAQNYFFAFEQWDSVLDILKYARDNTARDIDLQCKVAKKNLVKSSNGDVKEVYYYDSDQLLIDRIAKIHWLMSTCAEKCKNYSIAADYYMLTGDCYMDSESNVRRRSLYMYLNAAKNFEKAALYEKSLTAAIKCSQVVNEFYPTHEEECLNFISDLECLCDRMKEALQETHPVLSEQCSALIEKLTSYD